MTKKELVKMIINLEYNGAAAPAVIKSRTNDLMKYNKAFLIARVEHLTK